MGLRACFSQKNCFTKLQTPLFVQRIKVLWLLGLTPILKEILRAEWQIVNLPFTENGFRFQLLPIAFHELVPFDIELKGIEIILLIPKLSVAQLIRITLTPPRFLWDAERPPKIAPTMRKKFALRF